MRCRYWWAVVLVLGTARAAAAQQPEVMRVNAARVNLRRAPSIDSAIVRALSRGTVVTVVAHDGGWSKVEVGEAAVSGWIRSNLLVTAPGVAAAESTRSVGTPVAPPAPPRRVASNPPPPPARRESPPPQGAIHGPGYKDPGTALLFSVLITGGGQLYSGETNRGLLLLGVGVGSVLVGCGIAGSLSVCEVGVLVDLGMYVYGIVDAPASARRMNAAHGLGVSLVPMLVPTRRPRVGMALSIRF